MKFFVILLVLIGFIPVSYAQLDDNQDYSIVADESFGNDYEIYLEFSIIDKKVSINSSTVIFDNINYFFNEWHPVFYDKTDSIIIRGSGTNDKFENARILFSVQSEYHGSSPKIVLNGILVTSQEKNYFDSRATILKSTDIDIPQNIPDVNKTATAKYNETTNTKTSNDNGLKIAAEHTNRIEKIRLILWY